MSRLSRKGHLVLRLRPGWELEGIATHRDVRTTHALPATALDGGGPVDRAIRRHSPAMLVSRAFYSRQALGRPGEGHLGFDALEHSLGLARTFRVALDPEASVGELTQELRALGAVEQASPQWLVERPRTASGRTLAQGGAERAREAAAPWLDVDTDAARERVGAAEALELEPGDSALILALVDSGVDMAHPELSGRLRPGLSSVGLPAEEIGDGVVVVSGARTRLQNVEDDEGHGTLCAGILSANGFRVPRGLAGATRLLPVRALCAAHLPGRAQPTAIGSLPDIDSGVKTAVDLGARVLNLSFGTPEGELSRDEPPPHADVVRYALERGCVLVAASGNSGTVERYFPAALPGVLAVGAVDANGRPSHFTTRGPHVALCAPGENLSSTGLGGYTVGSGTSFAAPLVAAACALMLARASRHSTALAADTVRALLVRTASALGRGAEGAGCGAGILDVPAALRAVDDYGARFSGEAA